VTSSAQEAQWVLRAQCSDRDALELLLRGIQGPLHGYARGLVGSSAADDVLQEVLIIICRKLTWLHDPELFRPWAYRIASRVAIRHLKKQRRWPEQLPEDFALEEIPAKDLGPSTGALQDRLNLDSVSPNSRAVLMLHFQEELTLQEVAAILDIPLGTVKSRLAYGLTALRKQRAKTRSVE
jgi:RNA polymerase sigma-70 factor (ECF subfamily)